VAGDLTPGLVPVLGLKVVGPKQSNALVRVLVPAEKVWCLWPGIKLGGIAGFDGPGSVEARCCLVVRTSPAGH
jgi:hypothetical protein